MTHVEHIQQLARRFRIVDDADLELAAGEPISRKSRIAAFAEARDRGLVRYRSRDTHDSLIYEGDPE